MQQTYSQQAKCCSSCAFSINICSVWRRQCGIISFSVGNSPLPPAPKIISVSARIKCGCTPQPADGRQVHPQRWLWPLLISSANFFFPAPFGESKHFGFYFIAIASSVKWSRKILVRLLTRTSFWLWAGKEAVEKSKQALAVEIKFIHANLARFPAAWTDQRCRV